MISTVILTYNCIDTIERVIIGALSQKLTCDYEIIIYDDCSSDGTSDVISSYATQYPHLIVTLLRQSNVGPGVNWIEALSAARGEYIAYCEGDDYWILDSKLQRQLDFLTSNRSCDLVWTDLHIHDKISDRMLLNVFSTGLLPSFNSAKAHLLNKAFCAPSTWMFRRNVICLAKNTLLLDYVDGTFPIVLELLERGGICYLDFVSAVYTKHPASRTNNPDLFKRFKFARGIFRIQLDYVTKFSYPRSFRLRVVRKQSTRLLFSSILYSDIEYIRYLLDLDPSFVNQCIIIINKIFPLSFFFAFLLRIRKLLLSY